MSEWGGAHDELLLPLDGPVEPPLPSAPRTRTPVPEPRATGPLAPPAWTLDQLDAQRHAAIDGFRRERMEESLAEYLRAFDASRAVVEGLLRRTGDLRDVPIDVLADAALREAFRFVAGPPVSEDDWKVLSDSTLRRPSPDAARRALQTILMGLDRGRFPWVSEGRAPADGEREAAVVATASLLATRKTETLRRNEGKARQESATEQALVTAGFRRAPTRRVDTISHAPATGEFCRESLFGGRKADFIVGLWDGRKMPIECKVSNSSLNSVKRLNNDAAIKAVSWREGFGPRNVVPTAMLSGVYNLRNLADAQSRGLALFWAHALGDFTEWLSRAR